MMTRLVFWAVSFIVKVLIKRVKALRIRETEGLPAEGFTDDIFV